MQVAFKETRLSHRFESGGIYLHKILCWSAGAFFNQSIFYYDQQSKQGRDEAVPQIHHH